LIPLTCYCEIAASSQVETYSAPTSISITFFSIVGMDKKRKYFEDYLKFGLVGKNTVKPQCVLGNVVLCADTGFVTPSKFIQHLAPKPFNTCQRIYSSFKQVADL